MATYADFEKAAEESRQLSKKPTNEQLLELYALFKTSKDEDLDAAPQPGMFDIKGKAKLKAWTKVVKEDQLTPEQAQERYVKLVERLKVECDFDPNKVPEKTGSD